MQIPKICTNKFFLLAITASFAFTVSMYNIADNSIHDVKADFLTNIDKIDNKLDVTTQKIENILIAQARIEQKIDSLRP